MILASGFCRVPELEQAGCAVGPGVDGSASNDASNLIEEVRHAFLLQRVAHGIERVSHFDALRWATKARRAASGGPISARSGTARRPTSLLFKLDELRFSGCGDPLAASSCAARTGPTGSWSPGAGW